MCLAIPGKIIEIIDEKKHIALVDIAGVRRKINVTCILEEHGSIAEFIDSWVLVHVGFALALIDEFEAQATLALLEQLGEAAIEADI